MRNISKYRGSKGRHELSARGDPVWEFLIDRTSVWNAIKRKLYPREGFISVSPGFLCTTSEKAVPSQKTPLTPQNVVVLNSATRTGFTN